MNTDKLHPIDIEQLYKIIKNGIKNRNILGVPSDLWYINPDKRFETLWMGHKTGNPLGPAAGPHTQMAQNIIISWLCGSRYIELKTVQVLDELQISKPCIDMADEGYNCEWSQELNLKQSFNEYLKAWILIHIIENELSIPHIPCLFNMSVGYNLEGIQSEKVQNFIDGMRNCRPEKEKMLLKLSKYTNTDINIPDLICDTVTLSTMHGCPTQEIDQIARYLIDSGLHTIIKLNPTLLGKEELTGILNQKLNYKSIVPDSAFEHDLKFNEAVSLISGLLDYSRSKEIHFGIKLSNTLETLNNGIFDKTNKTMYLSGKALHPVTVQLAKKIRNVFGYKLPVSFSAGADCFNFQQLVAGGFNTITVCSDILKPGGYGRFTQYLNNLSDSFNKVNAATINQFIVNSSGIKNTVREKAAKINFEKYAAEVLENKYYSRRMPPQTIKTQRQLSFFDCIEAPCIGQCATHQHIPAYLYFSAEGDFSKAIEIVLNDNPFPHITGKICDHLCQLKCTRMNIDESLKIREVKSFISNWALTSRIQKSELTGKKAAIIGAGPAGLSCAYYLALSGFTCDVFEKTGKPGGMISWAIPPFRIRPKDIMADIARIEQAGVNIYYNQNIDKQKIDEFLEKYNFIFVSTGAWQPVKIDIEGIDYKGVIEPLEILFAVNQGLFPALGKKIVVIGGGNTAIDAARTAKRLAPEEAQVIILYRRTREEMPADISETEAALNEGIILKELVIPEKINGKDGKVTGIILSKAELKGKDASGRMKPEKIKGSEFELECDTIIPAIGQKQNLDFIEHLNIKINQTDGSTSNDKIFLGGDALRGPATAIKAIADGKNAALKILQKINHQLFAIPDEKKQTVNHRFLATKLATRIYSAITEPVHSAGFNANDPDRKPDEIKKEASRCLQCNYYCNICVSVCPNRAMQGFEVIPVEYKLKKAVLKADEIVFEDDITFSVKQNFQVINIIDFCNECGNCTTFCPTAGRPFYDKPRFCLTLESFKANNEVFYLSRLKDRSVLIYKDQFGIKTLTMQGNEYHYETDHVWAVFDLANFRIKAAKFRTACVRQSQFRFAAEMSILFHAANDLIF